jgi:hypothetical protein
MKLAINSDTRRVLSWGGEAITGLTMTRRDVFPVELKFIQGAGYGDLPDGSAGQLALKELGAWNGAIRATADWVKSGSGRNAVYTFMLSLDTPELNALFTAEPDSVNMAMEITWSYPVGMPSSWPLKGAYDNGYSYALNDVVLYQGGLYYRHSNPLNPGYPPEVNAVNASWTPVTQARETAAAVPVIVSNDYIR